MTEHDKQLLEDKIRNLESIKAELVWIQDVVNIAINEIDMFKFEIREILDAHG